VASLQAGSFRLDPDKAAAKQKALGLKTGHYN
jgi:hypothetical protein